MCNLEEEVMKRMDRKRLKDQLFNLDCPATELEKYDDLSIEQQINAYQGLVNLYESNQKTEVADMVVDAAKN